MIRKAIYYTLLPLALLADCIARRLLRSNSPFNPNFISWRIIRPGYGKCEHWYWRLVDLAYTLIRFVWRDQGFDINEDFHCGSCGRPVFRRLLSCSQECYEDLHRREME